jgi:hypothetical protein
MHMIDELVGHETALPSLLGTKRAGLGEFEADLTTADREGKPSSANSSDAGVRSASAAASAAATTP